MITEQIYTEAMRFLRRGKKFMRRSNGMNITPIAVPLSGGQTGYFIFDLYGGTLRLFVGENELQGYLRMADRLLANSAEDIEDTPKSFQIDTSYYRLGFTGSPALTPEEYALCQKQKRQERRGGHRRHGKKSSDPNEKVYPLLRLWEPHRLGREVTDSQALEWMEQTLQAANWYLDHFKSDHLLEMVKLYAADQLLRLKPQKEGYLPQTFPRPAVRAALFPLQALPPEMDGRMQELRNLPHSRTWEMMLIDLPPHECLTANGDPHSDYVHGAGVNTYLVCVVSGSLRGIPSDDCVVRDYADCPWHLLQVLTEQLLARHTCPEEVLVADDDTGMFLRQWCRRAGIRISRVRELESCTRVLNQESDEDLPEELLERDEDGDDLQEEADWPEDEQDEDGDGQEDELQQEIAAVQTLLDQLPQEAIDHLPAEVIEMFERMAARGDLTDENMRKLHFLPESPEEEEPQHPDISDPFADFRDPDGLYLNGVDGLLDRARAQEEWPIREDLSMEPRPDGRPVTRKIISHGQESTLILGSYEGSFVFSVSAGTGCYRHIQVSADLTLAEFGDAILEAFDIADRSKSHAFYLAGMNASGGCICGRPEDYTGEYNPEATTSHNMKLGSLRFLKRDHTLTYIYDFDEDWHFRCRVLRVLPENTDGMVVLRSRGEHPAH